LLPLIRRFAPPSPTRGEGKSIYVAPSPILQCRSYTFISPLPPGEVKYSRQLKLGSSVNMTKIINSISDFRTYRNSIASPKQTIGFVPTMGALHAGHQSLLKRCRQENDITVLSIFVNPHQFNNPDDLKNYPKNTEADLAIARNEKVDCVLLPNASDVYIDHYRYQIKENELSTLMEGQYRPGHFEAILTVVLKFLHVVQPQRLYLGEKDYQQYLLIKNMVEAFLMDIAVIPCPTVRDPDGLAMSSRNLLLTPEQRKLATAFPTILHNTKLSLKESQKKLEATGLKVEYLEDYQGRRFGAVYCGTVRLIDNVVL
jgi:pantoate--beta-alanine ligase